MSASQWTVHHGDCLDVMRGMADASVDAVVSDPPYAEVDRSYGRFTEGDWHALMEGVVRETRRVLRPSGSAVFILQPNSERVGRMRPWLFEFQAKIARDWNMVQDAWWWNHTTLPTIHTQARFGLLRPSVKACVWAGAPDCYRNQKAVAWTESESMIALRTSARASRGRETTPSGHSTDVSRFHNDGTSTPFNLLPIANANSTDSGGSEGHGAATPLPLCSWWVRYLTPPGGLVLDPFAGSGTTGVAALREGFRFVGIEREAQYVEIARRRCDDATRQGTLFGMGK